MALRGAALRPSVAVMADDDALSDEKADAIINRALAIGWHIARPAIVALIYVATLPALGAPLFKAATIGAIAFVLMLLPLGRRLLQVIAVALLAYALAWWLGALPAPAELRALATRVVR
jgi:hypothetical protein